MPDPAAPSVLEPPIENYAATLDGKSTALSFYPKHGYLSTNGNTVRKFDGNYRSSINSAAIRPGIQRVTEEMFDTVTAEGTAQAAAALTHGQVGLRSHHLGQVG
jgi:hypothetical protein